MKKLGFICSAILCVAFACSSPAVDGTSENTVEIRSSTPRPTFRVELSTTPTPPMETPTLQSLVCSPLGGETLQELTEIITQPFKTPRATQDDGHHGVDFAFYRRKELMSIDGLPILSTLDGKVVTIISDKYPYGNAIIIETQLDSLSPDLIEKIRIPEVQPTVAPDPKFNWTPGEFSMKLDTSKKSLYIVYAHLKYPAEVSVNDFIKCGQRIGQVGSTGDSTNPHLHFETRIGPSGASFDSMAYYTAQSTASERYNYVIWRVTNLFQLFDPMQLLSVDG